MYLIERNASQSRVNIVMNGPQDFDHGIFWEEFKEAVHFAKCARAQFDVLFDHRLKPILPPNRTKQGEDMALWCLQNGLRKSANIVPSTVMKMQLQRITARAAQFAYFETLEDGEKWLNA